MKLFDLLKRSAAKFPGRTAVIDDACEITYAKLLSNTEQLSKYLKSAGCRPGVKVAVVLPNSSVYFAAFFAISASGAAIVAMSSKMTVYEAAGFIKRADVSLVLTEKTFADNLAEQLGNKEQISIVTIEQNSDGVLKIGIFIQRCPKVDSDNSDVALMVYTSGTTGQSKIVMLTDDQLISNMFIYKAVMDFEMPNVVYCSLPLHHIYAICAQVLTHISCGDTFIAMNRPFFIKDFFKAVQNHKVTITAFVPYMAILMAEYSQPNQFDLSSLKYITLSGAKTPKHVYQKLTNAFDHIKFINTYGMSEAGSRISIAAPEPAEFPVESVGKAMPSVAIRITDNRGEVLPAKHIGQIEVKSSGVFKGYFNQPKLSKGMIVSGWLKTGDIGKLDTQGNLYLVGRKKEMIICGGENIFPAEIEETLLENPSVREAAIIGIPDDRLEEVPCAFVVPGDSFCSETDIINFCRKRLSSFKVPRKVFFIEQLPMLGTSKINRRKLKDIALDKLRIDK
ncbi:MAG TPA: class I adenylate-forming enzyme family protein [Sedimentisphaerales bacterium]|nr:class I adenylate-forming enzyme family protein [Sedimentisphaerales bacterium]